MMEVFLLASVVRLIVGLHGYSGQAKPPMFGDFEAQRHWLEITVNLDASDWYRNSSENDLLYWGLDYPPLTAYHSLLNGLVARKLNSSWVELGTSRGHESDDLKRFMRFTVLLADWTIFFSAVYSLSKQFEKQLAGANKLAFLLLLFPGFILIDHGHFQYNCVSLGFVLWTVFFLQKGKDICASVAFCLALFYKQMLLYYTPAVFCFLLARCFQVPTLSGRVVMFFSLALTVVISTGLMFGPIVFSDRTNAISAIQDILIRLFPFNRGIFEDKVSNLWCSLNVVVKFRQFFSQEALVKMATVVTLFCLLPSSIHLFWAHCRRLTLPHCKLLLYCLLNSSLAFFLASYQVHEKSILMAALPLLLLYNRHLVVVLWFTVISTLSMWPLLLKDGQGIPAVALTVLYLAAAYCVFEKQMADSYRSVSIFYLAFPFLSIFGGVCLIVCGQLIEAPTLFPDLWPLLISVYCCAHFTLFFLYFNFVQLTAGCSCMGELDKKTI